MTCKNIIQRLFVLFYLDNKCFKKKLKTAKEQVKGSAQMNPKEVFHNTAYSVQLPNITAHSL